MGNSLPWTDAIETQLLSMGVSCIEHLKECRIDEWNELFCCEPLIIKRVATRVFESFKLEGAFDPKSVRLNWAWHNLFMLFPCWQI